MEERSKSSGMRKKESKQMNQDVTLHVPPALTYVLIVLVVVVGSVYWPDAEGPRVETFSALLCIRRVICIYIFNTYLHRRGLDRVRCNLTNAYKIVDRVQCMQWNLITLIALADWLAALPRLAPAY